MSYAQLRTTYTNHCAQRRFWPMKFIGVKDPLKKHSRSRDFGMAGVRFVITITVIALWALFMNLVFQKT